MNSHLLLKSYDATLRTCPYSGLTPPVWVSLSWVHFTQCNQSTLSKSKPQLFTLVEREKSPSAIDCSQVSLPKLHRRPFESFLFHQLPAHHHHYILGSPLFLFSFLLHIMLPATSTGWVPDILSVFWSPCLPSRCLDCFQILELNIPSVSPSLPDGLCGEEAWIDPSPALQLSCLTLSKLHPLPSS